jgi:hypothetical protein
MSPCPPTAIPNRCRFGIFTADLHRLAQWLKACRIQTVAMQSSGVYWIGLHQILEEYDWRCRW